MKKKNKKEEEEKQENKEEGDKKEEKHEERGEEKQKNEKEEEKHENKKKQNKKEEGKQENKKEKEEKKKKEMKKKKSPNPRLPHLNLIWCSRTWKQKNLTWSSLKGGGGERGVRNLRPGMGVVEGGGAKLTCKCLWPGPRHTPPRHPGTPSAAQSRPWPTHTHTRQTLQGHVTTTGTTHPAQGSGQLTRTHPLPVAGVGVGVEPEQGLLVHDCSDRLAGHPWVSSPPGGAHSCVVHSRSFLSSGGTGSGTKGGRLGEMESRKVCQRQNQAVRSLRC